MPVRLSLSGEMIRYCPFFQAKQYLIQYLAHKKKKKPSPNIVPHPVSACQPCKDS